MFLLIDTATERATVALAEREKIVAQLENASPKDHAAWLHPAIEGLLSKAGVPIRQLKAVGLSSGPGSYTGLRVGMAAAKGLCFALDIPLIAVGTLRLMAEAMLPQARSMNALVGPMIDARREEVYTALYRPDMKEISAPQALILDKSSFEDTLKENTVIFSGNGAAKWESVNSSAHAIFLPQTDVNESFAKLTCRYYDEKNWVDAAYSEPVYLKEFHTHSKK